MLGWLGNLLASRFHFECIFKLCNTLLNFGSSGFLLSNLSKLISLVPRD